jgi:arylsulfatase A-like enzyme
MNRPGAVGWRQLFAIFLWGLAGMLASATAAGRPNILYILTDDQSFRTMGCYREEGAYDWVRTPNLDRLAQRGVRFTHAYLGSWCLPSRYTALTGLHPYGIESLRHGLVYPRNSYDPDRVTFWPRVFRAEGYYTGMIGKWHTGKDAGFGRDWDYQIVWNRPAGSRANAGAYYGTQELHFHGSKKPVRVEGYPADHYTGWAVDFIRERAGSAQPWALWLCYPNAHPPFVPAERNQQEFAGVKVPTPVDIFVPAPGKPAYLSKIHAWSRGPDGEPLMRRIKTPTAGGGALREDNLSAWCRQYQQSVSAIDEGVGKILAALHATGQDEETLVIFTSDQGFALGQHGFAHKLAPYDANIRSPLIISQPGTIPQGQVCRTPVGGVDLVATIYSRGGVRAPEPLDGHDLTPLLGNPARSNWNHPVVQSYTRMGFGEKTAQVWRSRSPVGPPVPWWVSVVQGHYKYVRTMVRGEVEELYDLREDPEELVNLALRKQDAKLLDEMRTTLDRELKRTNAPFVNRMPDTGTSAALAKAERAVHPGPGSGLKAIFGRHSDRVNRPETGRVSKPGRLFGKSLVQAAKPGKRACLGLKS